MILSDFCIKRPVFASVLSILLIVFGVISFQQLPLREYPNIDPPIVTVSTSYPGAAANVVEARITEKLEERIAGLEGIRTLTSSSSDGNSNIRIEFNLDRDIDAATNDVRDRVSRIIDDLPVEADVPEVQKQDSNDDVIMWLNLVSDKLTVPELTDYASRYLVDQFSVADGVARVRIGGGQEYAMRIWVDRFRLAAHRLTVSDIEDALRRENVELPAGQIESSARQFTLRVNRLFVEPESFAELALKRGDDGHIVRLGDVATVVKGTREHRISFRGNGVNMVGLGMVKQSTANTIDVSRSAREIAERLNPTLPEGMEIKQSYDSAVYIEQAIQEVYKTLAIAIALVVLVILIFLRSVRAMLVPAVTVPVSLIATFILLQAMGFSINLLTLLALVLAIGLVVDDAIVVLENIYRRMQVYGETPLVAAFKGTRQVGFAVIATTAVLVAVFAPITVIKGDIGRLFSEFALTMTAAVIFSSFVALTLSPVLASLLLKQNSKINNSDDETRENKSAYLKLLKFFLRQPWWIGIIFAGIVAIAFILVNKLPSEYAPKEDRGAFFIVVNGPEGASYAYMKKYMDEIERRLMPLAESGEAQRLLVRVPGFTGGAQTFNSGIVIVLLDDWANRRSAFEIIGEVRKTLADLPGVLAFPIMRQGIGGRLSKPVEFVIGGGSYEELASWRDTLVGKINENNPGFVGLDWDYKETSPQIRININYDRAADLGVSVSNIGRTLESMLASRRVTTFLESGEEYDVIIEGIRELQNSPQDLTNIYLRSDRSGELIPLSNVVSFSEYGTSKSLNRYNRTRAITLTANLKDDFPLGEALSFLETTVKEHLPEQVVVDYKGRSRDYKYAGGSTFMMFGLGVLVMFLVLAAQFESYVNPFIIILTVPLAIAGGLLGLYVTGNSLNLFSQIGLIMLIGLAAKNGILIVEFANQLRNEGKSIIDAITTSAAVRLRPIVMTSITTITGSIPLILSFGAGSENRMVLGVTLLSGVAFATIFTLFVVPTVYTLLARFTTSSDYVARKLEKEMN